MQQRCTQAILDPARCPYPEAQVQELKVLFWYRQHSAGVMAIFQDGALCWARLSTKAGPRWALAAMAQSLEHDAKNPAKARIWKPWAARRVRYCAEPPRFPDLEAVGCPSSMLYLAPGYEPHLESTTWMQAMGEPPRPPFVLPDQMDRRTLGEEDLGRLRSACERELHSRSRVAESFTLEDFKVLSWCRFRDERCWFVDDALCWVKLGSKVGPRWAILKMSQHPYTYSPEWRLYSLDVLRMDLSHALLKGMTVLEAPPRNRDIYAWAPTFGIRGEPGWSTYASHMDAAAWERLIGEPPRIFPVADPASGPSGKHP